MSNSVNDIPAGLRVPAQIPLDAKVYKLSQADLSNLGPSNNLAYTYFKGMIAYCAQEQTRWEWREPKFVGEVGLLSSNFVYPDNLSIFGIDYSLKTYNFFLMPTASAIAGPQGIPGPTGPPGPVGPAGLEWRGSWVSGTSYVADDAVGYNGASWFCILATSGTTTPNLDTTHWALLAAQGAQGPPGIPGTSIVASTENLASNTNSAPFPDISKTFTFCVSTGFAYALPSNPILGDIRYVRTVGAINFWASPNPGNDGANNYFITPIGNGNSFITLQSQKCYRFTYLGRFGGVPGYWTVEIMNNI